MNFTELTDDCHVLSTGTHLKRLQIADALRKHCSLLVARQEVVSVEEWFVPADYELITLVIQLAGVDWVTFILNVVDSKIKPNN